MIDLLNKLKALRTLGLNYIGYDSQTEKFKAYEKMCIEEEIWSNKRYREVSHYKKRYIRGR